MKNKNKKYILKTCLNCQKEFITCKKSLTCGYSCSASDYINVFSKKIKIKKTCQERYGVDNILLSELNGLF